MSDLKIRITADTTPLKAAFSEAQQAVRGATGQMQQQFKAAGDQIAATAQRTSGAFDQIKVQIGAMVGAFAAFAALRGMAQISDDAALATARINGLTGSILATREAQAQLFEMSQRLQAPYNEAVSSFSRMLPAVQQLGGGISETTRLTEILMTTAKLSGASAAEAGASALQFAQALGSGVLQGDELRSILENNNTLARTLAGGLGVTVGELRKLGEQGKLTADLVANTLLGQYDDIKSKAAQLPSTVGGAWTQVTNAFTQFVTATANGSGVFGGLAAVFTEVAKVVAIVAKAMSGAGEESDKLKGSDGAQTFARAIGYTFAWLADVIGAAITGIVEGVQALTNNLATMGGAVVGLFRAIGQAATGDFSGAADTLKTQASLVRDAWVQTSDAIASSFNRAKDAIAGNGAAVTAYRNQLGDATAAGVEGGGSANLTGGGGGGGKEPKAKSRMAEWDAILQADRLAYAQQQADAGTHLAFSQAQEADYWRQRLQQQGLTAEERLAIERKVVQLQLSEAEAANAKQLQLSDKLAQSEREAAEIRMQMAQTKALAEIDSAEQAAQFQLQNGEITRQQLLEAEQAFELARYEIRAKAAQQTLELIRLEGRDPAAVEQVNAQLLDLEIQFQQRKAEIGQQVAMAAGDKGGIAYVWRDAQQAMQRGVASMLSGAQTLRQGLAGVWAGIRSSIIGEIAKIMVAKVAAFAREKVLALAGITMHAAKAGAGAAESQASIPYVGPVLALAAMAAVAAAVLGLSSGIKSAAGGYDIPAGINPVTRLHASEMVLPAEHAETIRRMSEQGGGGNLTVELRGHSAGDFFIAHRSEIVKAIRAAHRGFAFT